MGGKNARRGQGEGSVFYDEKRRRWVALLDMGRDGSGKRRRVWRSAQTKGEATALLRALQSSSDRGDDPRGARRTAQTAFADLRGYGLDTRLAESTRYKTLHYAGRFADAMGSRPLREISVRHVEQWLKSLAEEQKARRTLTEARMAASQLIDHAIRMGWLPPERNSARLARLPETTPTKPRPVLTDSTVTKLLDAKRDDHWFPLLAFVATTGVRIGEAAGLAWSDVDTDASVAVIRRAVRIGQSGKLSLTEPKANSSRRILLAPELLELMRQHRTATAERLLGVGRTVPDLAFPTVSGTVADPNHLRRWLREVAGETGIEVRGFHDFRHATASSLADAGEAPIRVAALLGHATPRTTLGVYTHPVTPHADAGLDRGSRLLKGSA